MFNLATSYPSFHESKALQLGLILWMSKSNKNLINYIMNETFPNPRCAVLTLFPPVFIFGASVTGSIARGDKNLTEAGRFPRFIFHLALSGPARQSPKHGVCCVWP